MKLTDALLIVIDLASENALLEEEWKDVPELQTEARKQEKAIDKVIDFYKNLTED
jgi:hypothetical protein